MYQGCNEASALSSYAGLSKAQELFFETDPPLPLYRPSGKGGHSHYCNSSLHYAAIPTEMPLDVNTQFERAPVIYL